LAQQILATASIGEIVGIDSALALALLSREVPRCKRVRDRLQPYRNETVCLHVNLEQGFLVACEP
jgi:hypothetical protein